MIDPELAPVLRACAVQLDRMDADWAVGGATAMAVHGFERATKDVDLFIADEARMVLLAALRKQGLAVQQVFPPSHYAVRERGQADPDMRVDLLFPALGVESLGMMAARPASLAGRQMPVFPMQHLVAAKLLVDPVFERARYDKDCQDLRELRARGLIDTERVLAVLEDLHDRPAMERLRALMKPAGAREEPPAATLPKAARRRRQP
jgi:hypothetical protein